MVSQFFYCLVFLSGSISICYGQASTRNSGRWDETDRRFYIGLERIIFANQLTQFTRSAPFLSAADKDLAPAPALAVGYKFSPRFAVEARFQDLPVMTGYSYQRETTSQYLGFGQRYTQDYLYIPLHGVVQLLGLKRRLGLSIIAGGGPAWTDTKPNPINPNGTQVFTSSSNGTIGVGPNPASGTTILATVTQQITQQQALFAAFEAGVRGSWHVLPHLHLDLTVRQLWSTTHSARDISLVIQTDSNNTTTMMTTPVQGICTGLTVRYSL